MALLTGCRGISQTLREIESYIQEAPDSALNSLQRIDDRDLHTASQRAHYALLMSWALDKNYIDVVDDSLARVANDYYSRHGSTDHRMKSWYYLGIVQENAGDDVRAIYAFKQAEELSLQTKDWHYAGLIAKHIALLYDHAYDNAHAEEYTEKSRSYFKKSEEPLYYDYATLSLAINLKNQRQIERSDSLYRMLLSRSDLPSEMLPYLYYTFSGLHMVKTPPCPDSCIYYFSKAQALNEKEVMKPQSCLAAWAYEEMGMPDLADRWIENALDHSNTSADTAMVLSERSRILESRGRFKESLRDLSETIDREDSILTEALKNSVSSSISYYYQEEVGRERLKNERNRWALSFLLAAGCLAAVLAVNLLRHYRKKVKEKEDSIRLKEAEIASLRSSMDDMQDGLEQLKQDLSNLAYKYEASSIVLCNQITDRVTLINTMMHQYDVLCAQEDARLSYMDQLDSLRQIVKEHHDLMGSLRMDPTFLSGLEEALDAGKDHVMSRLRACFGTSFREEDYRLLACFIAGLQPKSVSFITGLSHGNVRTRKSRLKDKIQAIPDSEERAFFLSMLE